jgi:hypothetical protein
VSTGAEAAAVPVNGGAAGRAGHSSPLLAWLALFAGAALISGFTILRGGAEFDEGAVLAAAARVASGEVPYRDFLWPYGPAEPYVLGAWFELFDPSLLSWRVLRVGCDAAIAVTVFALVRREAPLPLAVIAWLAAACVMAQPTSATPFPYALLAVLLAFLVATPQGPPTRLALIATGALVAVAAAWRLDFALYGGVAVATALALRPEPGRLRSVLVFGGVAGGMSLLVYLPFVVMLGPADLYDELVGTSLREKEWWTLPFPWSYDGELRAWPPGTFAADLKDATGFYLPLIALVGLAVALIAWLPRAREGWRLAGLLVLGLCFVAYLLSRTDEFHVTPLLVVLALALPLCLAFGAPRPVLLACAAVLALITLHGLANRVSALADPPPLATIDLPAADGTKAPPRDARALERAVAHIQRLVPPGEPIYVATRRSDLVAFNDPRMYVLAERPNAAPFDFGLLARPKEQREVVRSLEREQPRVVVRWLDPISTRREANLRGEPTGERIVDRWLARDYRETARYGDYALLEPRGRSSETATRPPSYQRRATPIAVPSASPRAFANASPRRRRERWRSPLPAMWSTSIAPQDRSQRPAIGCPVLTCFIEKPAQARTYPR